MHLLTFFKYIQGLTYSQKIRIDKKNDTEVVSDLAACKNLSIAPNLLQKNIPLSFQVIDPRNADMPFSWGRRKPFSYHCTGCLLRIVDIIGPSIPTSRHNMTVPLFKYPSTFQRNPRCHIY